MGRIKKAATERHTATASPFILTFVEDAISASLYHLPAKLRSFPQQWPFPRGDLYHWIPLLDRFDHILDLFNQEYGLVKGPQQEPFECRLLLRGDAEDGMPYPSRGTTQQELDTAEYTSEGDAEVVEYICHFTRVLLEHCGNRSLYNSSGHLDSLLNTTSLSLLRQVLRLGVRLAQRYQVARYKNSHPSAHPALLANHYNFTFDRLQKIADPFSKAAQSASSPVMTAGKGKEKASQAPAFNPSDLVLIAKEPHALSARGDLASVQLIYYDQTTSSRPATAPSEVAPTTPTPVRRTSALGPLRDRPSLVERSSTTNDVNSPTTKQREPDSSSSAPKTFQVPSSKVAETSTWALIKDALSKVPPESWYEVLTKIRIAKALVTPEKSSQQLLEVRLLAIANLAYACSESKFQERVGIPDSEEPKRFHLAQQLCDLLQPPSNRQVALSLDMETTVLLTIEALSKSRHKSSEVSDALQISHNHGVIYYELRKVIATLNADEHQDSDLELRETEWREATFDLTNALLQSNTTARHGERMVNAGIMGILIEALSLRTARAERFHEKVLQFFDSFIHGITTAFQTLADVKGLDILADLMSYEVTSSLTNAKDGSGLPLDLKSKVVDYNIPYYQQATLRQLFKFTAHMFDHNAGTHDRLLRNLVDTPQVLGALRNVIDNAHIFGSNVWSGALNIMSSFIHNEPTSFQVVGEAGLVKSLLQTIVPWELKDAGEDDTKLEDVSIALEYKDGELQYPSPSGILPVGETMCDIPAAFGAICLNESGMKLFQSSKALLKFMDIFVSPSHVKALEEEGQTAATIGQAFDELSRHHPQLKEQITWTVIAMVKRVNEACRYLSEHQGNGAKLWEKTPKGIVVSGGQMALSGPTYLTESDQSRNKVVAIDDLQEGDIDRAAGVPFISVCFKFLEGFFHNPSMCSQFCEQGGAVHLLDLATSPSNPHDMVAFPVFSKIAQVVKVMCEAKPHLVLPSLIRKTQIAIAGLKPVVESKDPEGAFKSFTDLSQSAASSPFASLDGTIVAKSLGMAHMLTHLLGRAFAPPQFTNRHGSQLNQLFTTLNFTDVYIELVDNLGLLHAACVWENLALQKSLPERWMPLTEPKPFMMRRIDAAGVVEIAAEARSDTGTNGEKTNGPHNVKPEEHKEELAIKNGKALRYLLSQTPMGIESFFHSLGQSLVPKRSGDHGPKQQAAVVADHLANALVQEFDHKKFDPADELTQFKALSHAVSLCTRSLLKSAHTVDASGSKEALTLVLTKFYLANGFGKLKECLQRCTEVLAKHSEKAEPLVQTARDTLSNILGFYKEVARPKTINDAVQSGLITNRHTESPDYFVSGQFMVEVRDAIIPALSELWHSPVMETLGDNHVKTVIEALNTILTSSGEERAITRSQKATRRVQTAPLEFKLKSTVYLQSLTSHGHDESLAREALYRCNSNENNALNYCQLRKTCSTAPSFPIPTSETAKHAHMAAAPLDTTSGTDPASSSSQAVMPQRDQSIEMTDAVADPSGTNEGNGEPPTIGAFSEDPDVMSDDDSFHGDLPSDLAEGLMAMTGDRGFQAVLNNMASGIATASSPNSLVKDTQQPFTTVDDLDEKRANLRDDLLERCLEILSAQPSITFELAELILAAVPQSGEGANPRADIGSTLVSSLLSLQAEEPSAEAGAKIAAYAHLVALILQDRDFFDSTLDELKENLDPLISWLQLTQDQKVKDAPWTEMVLLIIERVLVEDEQPARIEWHAPPADDPLQALAEPGLPEVVVSSELRSILFDTIIELLPKIGKSTVLALSVCRVLVILTRKRELAMRMSDKLNMSRLFMMIRQLAGLVNEKIQGAFMVILRNMIEDETILRQIMQTEIKAVFENHRTARTMDTLSYSRALYHLVLRDPQLFVNVTKDIVEIPRYEVSPRSGAQQLALKKETTPFAETSDAQAKAGQSEVQKSVENGSTESQKMTEIKPPIVEVTDGVVQFLLRELSSYRDVEEKPAASAADTQHAMTNGSTDDVDMSDAASSTNGSTTDANKIDKPAAFKAEDHAIYIYRCFIMQCLTELLFSYNRTKVEFINFSRKPEAQNATPSKPRSGTLNYLLNVLIPIGTLEHRDDISHRKKLSTSHWATTVLVALCSKTSEKQTPRHMTLLSSNEEASDLTYVRKFVLEHGLRSFKDATTSLEPLDQRYSRLLALGELFNRMLSTKTSTSNMAGAAELSSARQIGRIMYEKNFISALTSAIAELDLNFPNAKRAVKYMLGPLKSLTDLGVVLSQVSDFSSTVGGSTDAEEISSATSVSDDEDDEDREETPDLYRNSTLGLFEANGGHEDESDSDSQDEDDEDIYEHGYDDDDGMDYEDGPMPDRDEVVSDEDEDGMGDVEGLPGDVEYEMDVVMDNEDDEADTISEDNSEESSMDDGEEDEEDDPDSDGEMEEITGDDENASMADPEEDHEWDADHGALFDVAVGEEGGSPHGGPLDHIRQVIGADDGSDPDGVVRIDMGNGEEEFFDDEMPPEDDEDEDEEIDFENDLVEFEEDDDDDDDDGDPHGLRDDGWGMGVPPPPHILRGHHHHHHHRHAIPDMFGMVGGDTFRGATFRTHNRPASNTRGDEDGINPLLQRNGGGLNHRERDIFGDASLPGRLARRAALPRQADSFIQDLVATIGPNGGHTININIADANPRDFGGGLPPMFAIQGRHGTHALLDFDPTRPWRDPIALPRWPDMMSPQRTHESRTFPSSDEAQAVDFHPVVTTTRWQEAARMLFNKTHLDAAYRINDSLLRVLIPPAMEVKRQSDKAEAERKAADEKAKEEERKQVEAEKAEREAREKQEEEERQAREAEEARVQREVTAAEGDSAHAGDRAMMEGVEQSQPTEPAAREPQSGVEASERVTTTIRGRELDITSLGIDLEYLQELPEELREEVIMGQFANQRSQAVEAGEQPSEISREFLEALPPEIQRELLRQEAVDRRRREHDENRRSAAQEGNAQPAQAEEMNNADFMAMLEPRLRQEILMDADEGVLATFPEDIQAEARGLLGDRRLPRADQIGRLGRLADAEARVQRFGQEREASRQHRPVIQMLDKAGIATLLRLMFVSLHHKAKSNLHSILSDVCKNTQNRAEVISILLSILQDGTADVAAVERSFANLSLRAKQASGPKTPTPLKRTPTGTLVTPGAELSPLNIVQQCLGTLNALTMDNSRSVPTFFLIEHENTSQKTKSTKKGKGREVRASKFPLNSLLTLLDRKLITENTGVMEALASLLSRITVRLPQLLQKEAKDKTEPQASSEGQEETSLPAGADVPMGEATPADAPTVVATSAEPSNAAAEPSEAVQEGPDAKAWKESKTGDEKKRREMVAPDVPEENIRLVVNIITARECPAKTFTDTLDVIKNLSAIPGARAVFGKELVSQAQDLSQAVLIDLEDLAKQINDAQTGTDLQGMALANFSSAASMQHKLLRVLVALDYLFDTKQNGGSSSAAGSAETEPNLKDDILAGLYESSTFDKLWGNLSQCLTALRKRGNMVNVAAILLPMIESLMVVCRNSTLKDALPDQAPASATVGTPPPEARLDSLFFRFTEEHRKILNELIRNNPKLMNGNISVLAKNSKVLEFDNKRNFFTRKLHSRSANEGRASHPSLQLSVRRDQVFLDSYKFLYYKSGNEIKHGKLNIRFNGEEGIDAGGVSREWFAAMARQMFNPDYALFIPVASDKTTFHPNKFSDVNDEHLKFFKFIGRIIGKALYEGRVLDCHFSRAVYRRILGKSVSLKDMESLDLDYYKSLLWILENDITDITFETFSVDVERFGLVETVDLVPDGSNIPVTEDNKQEYVRLVVEHRLIKSVEEQLGEFLTGFHDIIPPELVSIFNEQELELLISGLPEIDVDDWKNNTEYHNYQATSAQIQWFWRAVRSFDKEERAKLLQFVTGTSKVPLNGFKELEGMNGFSKFNIHRDYSSKEKLPSSHTCFNQLDLPEYESYEHLRQQLYTAITAGSEYFGFA